VLAREDDDFEQRRRDLLQEMLDLRPFLESPSRPVGPVGMH